MKQPEIVSVIKCCIARDLVVLYAVDCGAGSSLLKKWMAIFAWERNFRLAMPCRAFGEEENGKMLIGAIHVTRSFVAVSSFSQLAKGDHGRKNATREDDERAPDLH